MLGSRSETVVQLLLENGVDANAQGGRHGNALQAASTGGHEPVVWLLLEKGADVNTQGGYYGNALQAVSAGGHETVVQLLLDKGADVNTQRWILRHFTPCGFSWRLRDGGAVVNDQGEEYGNASFETVFLK